MAIVLSASQRLALKANLDYWRRREEEARKHYIAEDDALEAKINSKYNYLYMQLDERINAFYSRYATAEGIDMATAQQKVSKADIKAYSERAKQYVEAAARMRKAQDEGNFALAEQLKRYVFSDEANEAMRLYNATMKINRLEMLKSQMGLDMVETFNGIQQDLGEGLDARTLEELERQAGILGETVTTTRHRIDAIVNASFNNATWSQRIWMYQTQMRDALGTLLTDGIIQGRNPVDLARDLRKIVGGSVKNTERLLRTEMARVQTAAQENAYKEGGFEQYIFLALGTACPICRALDEQVFDIKLLDNNQFAPPVHPNCRCSTAAYVDRDEMERELFREENSLQDEEEQGIIQAGGIGSAGSIKTLLTPEERANIIREASQTKDAIYAEDLRAAYYGYAVMPKDDLFDVVIHGSQTWFEYEKTYRIDAETLAYMISARRDYKGHDIRLLSCDAGMRNRQGKCVAQELSNLLRVRVNAPIDKLKINPDGKLTVGKSNLSEEDGFAWFDPEEL